MVGRASMVLLAALALAACTKKDSNVPEPKPSGGGSTSTFEEPPERSTANSATLDITSKPSATIILNGKSVGKTPMTVDHLAAGTYEVTFDFGEEKLTQTVELGEGEYRTVSQNISPTSADAKPVK